MNQYWFDEFVRLRDQPERSSAAEERREAKGVRVLQRRAGMES